MLKEVLVILCVFSSWVLSLSPSFVSHIKNVSVKIALFSLLTSLASDYVFLFVVILKVSKLCDSIFQLLKLCFFRTNHLYEFFLHLHKLI